jgi:AhpD family alkylhydroperoxidase
MRVTVNTEQIRHAFEQVSGDPAFEESRALVEAGGQPLEMIRAMCLRPEILRAFGQTGHCVYPGGLLERSVKELVIIEASRLNQCQFCTQTHIVVARMLGIGNQPLSMLDHLESLADRERLAVEYTRAAMTDSNRVPESLFAQLRASFSDPEIVELTFLIGLINLLNLFNNCLQVTYWGELDATSASSQPRSADRQ